MVSLYTDGARAQNKIPELTRAAAAVIAMDAEGNKVATAQSAVPRHLLQTAPAAEFLAANTAHKLAQPPATIHTDCLNVYKAMQIIPYISQKSPYTKIIAEI